MFYEQAVYGRGTKILAVYGRGTAYLRLIDSKMVIAMLTLLFNSLAGNNLSTVQRTVAKEDKNGFLRPSCNTSSGA